MSMIRNLVRFHRVDGIYVDNVRRLVWILREKYPMVLEADRRFEEETNFRNKVGTNNLVDALSHIGTLFESRDASYDQQRAQVALFEDHLRRTMMEAWEQMLTFQAGEIDKLWYGDYLTIARPLQTSGKLHGSPSADELDTRRKRGTPGCWMRAVASSGGWTGPNGRRAPTSSSKPARKRPRSANCSMKPSRRPKGPSLVRTVIARSSADTL